MTKFFTKLREPKSSIGWAHGILATISAIILGFVTMINISLFIPSDIAVKIIPNMIITPIIICIYGLWILFSTNLLEAMKKSFFTLIILIVFFQISSYI